MDEAAKRRLVGAAVLVALAVIFVPMLVEQDEDGLGEPIVIPEPPEPWSDLGGEGAGANDLGPADDGALAEPNELPLPLPIPEPPASAVEDESVPSSPTPIPPSRDSMPPSRATAAPTPAPRRESSPPPAAPKPLPPGTMAWVVQVASLGSPEAARELQDVLRGKGYPAFVEQATVSGRQYYRVRVGPEVERARADRLAKKLAAETSGQPLVQRYR
jgi:DedD protein